MQQSSSTTGTPRSRNDDQADPNELLLSLRSCLIMLRQRLVASLELMVEAPNPLNASIRGLRQGWSAGWLPNGETELDYFVVGPSASHARGA